MILLSTLFDLMVFFYDFDAILNYLQNFLLLVIFSIKINYFDINKIKSDKNVYIYIYECGYLKKNLFFDKIILFFLRFLLVLI